MSSGALEVPPVESSFLGPVVCAALRQDAHTGSMPVCPRGRSGTAKFAVSDWDNWSSNSPPLAPTSHTVSMLRGDWMVQRYETEYGNSLPLSSHALSRYACQWQESCDTDPCLGAPSMYLLELSDDPSNVTLIRESQYCLPRYSRCHYRAASS